MNFQLDKSIDLLQRTPGVFKSLLYELNHDWCYINEGKNTWSAYDIIKHLIYDEVNGWIPRARIILSDHKNKTFEPLYQFPQEEVYADKTIEIILYEFEELRSRNLQELKSWRLTNVDLDKEGIHPKLGTITLRELLATWTIHDIAHLNQASRVLVKHYSKDVGPFSKYLSILN